MRMGTYKYRDSIPSHYRTTVLIIITIIMIITIRVPTIVGL